MWIIERGSFQSNATQIKTLATCVQATPPTAPPQTRFATQPNTILTEVLEWCRTCRLRGRDSSAGLQCFHLWYMDCKEMLGKWGVDKTSKPLKKRTHLPHHHITVLHGVLVLPLHWLKTVSNQSQKKRHTPSPWLVNSPGLDKEPSRYHQSAPLMAGSIFWKTRGSGPPASWFSHYVQYCTMMNHRKIGLSHLSFSFWVETYLSSCFLGSEHQQYKKHGYLLWQSCFFD